MHDGKGASDEVGMTSALQAAWTPTFQKQPDHDLQPQALELIRPFVQQFSDEWLEAPPPASTMFSSYSLHARSGATGIDLLLTRPGARRKGERRCSLCSSANCVRDPSELRPLGLKNSDNKTVAGVGNRLIKGVTQLGIDGWQQGLIPGRNFLGNPVALDAIARKVSFPSLGPNLPIFSCFDVASAFPSLLHSFILWLFATSGAPPWISAFVESFYTWCLAFIPGNGTLFFLRVLSGIIQGCPLSVTIFAHCSHPLPAALKFFLAAMTGEDHRTPQPVPGLRL